ncbi:MAG: DNA-binding protein [Acidimicrobiales bacterium]
MTFKNRIKKITTPVGQLDKERLRKFCSGIERTVPIGDVRPRQEVTVVGEISSIRIVPRPDGSPWLEASISDGTGCLVAMWTGRTRIAGVSSGRRLMVSGRGAVSGSGRRLVICNPRYELLG